jgi:hypothetical protein
LSFKSVLFLDISTNQIQINQTVAERTKNRGKTISFSVKNFQNFRFEELIVRKVIFPAKINKLLERQPMIYSWNDFGRTTKFKLLVIN